MTFRYIGSKARLASALADAIEPFRRSGGCFVDAFAGTGAVSAVAADAGWPVWINDTLASAGTMSVARLIASSQAAFERLGGYANTIRALNELRATKGYFHATYSPASAKTDVDGIARMYLTEENASRLDAVRDRIGTWKDEQIINDEEETLLLADTIAAVNRCANIAGTYGCYLSKWQASALKPLALAPRQLRLKEVSWRVSTGDAALLDVQPRDLVYIDPPYTKRQYASYYHILESIVLNDKPEVEGVSGLRPWRAKASAFCYKRRALQALVNLVEKLGSDQVILSYSSEGHVELEDLLAALGVSGTIDCEAIDGVGRYRPNRTASARGDAVTEYVIVYRRSTCMRVGDTSLSSSLREIAA